MWRFIIAKRALRNRLRRAEVSLNVTVLVHNISWNRGSVRTCPGCTVCGLSLSAQYPVVEESGEKQMCGRATGLQSSTLASAPE